MTRMLLTISGAVPATLDDDIAAGRRPRADYRAIADSLGAELMDEPTAQRVSRLARLAARVAGPHVGLSVASWRTARDVDVVITDAEHTGLPLAVWYRLESWCRLGRRRRPRHVMISHRLAWGRKMQLHRWLRLGAEIDTYVVYSTEQRRLLIDEMGIDPSSVVLTGFMVDDRFWHEAPFPPADGRPRICAVGLERRDYETLLAAVDGLDVDLVVTAGSPWSVRLWSPAGEVPANVTVTTVPFAELRGVYAQSWFSVVPLEPVDFQAGVTAILESMAVGRPVLHTAVPGQTDVIVDGVTGRTVPPRDPAAMRRAIVEMVGDHAGLARMGAAARHDVETRFALDGYVRRIGAAAGAELPAEATA